ncbi:MAG TPA: SDR family NAD(P)-dependent oxidoreductase [Acidimicrobiales bacterium]|nr:SDR family NAD(P)-dependent oxidoreductase [Acidimicrobiales bacterium]
MRLRRSVVVVTGASAGIGRAVAARLARKGALVWAVARSEGALEELAGAEPNVVPFVADLTSDADRAALVEAAGRVDILVNNAGIGISGLVADTPQEQVRQLFEINVLGLIDLTQRVLPGMLERRHGHIVNIASAASWAVFPPLTVYSASKFAVLGFTQGLRREMRGKRVTVASIHPGPVATAFGARAARGDRPTEELGHYSMPGVPAEFVARAVERSIRLAGVPGYAEISVPRALGISRLAQLPVVNLLLDVPGLMTRQVAAREPSQPVPPRPDSE